ncbi:hypothetical protein Ddc_07017 [Ditylenchus destructor]|nr:hypothetical protein Ddc_07017 [Ditylenchus destructor]
MEQDQSSDRVRPTVQATVQASPAFLAKTGFVSETRGLRPLEACLSSVQLFFGHSSPLESRPVQRSWPRLAPSVGLACFGCSKPSRVRFSSVQSSLLESY